MPISVTCPKCGGVLNAPDNAGGKRGRCPTCQTILSIPMPGSESAPPLGSGLRPSSPATGNPFAEQPPAPSGTLSYTPTPSSIPTPPLANPMSGANPVVKFPAPDTPAGGTFRMSEEKPALSSPRSATLAKGVSNVPSRADLQLPGLPNPASGPRPKPQLPPLPNPPSLPQGPMVPEHARGWRKVASGLGWLRFSVWMIVLATFAVYGLMIAEHYQKLPPLPEPLLPHLAKLHPNPNVALHYAVASLFLIFATLGHLIGRCQISASPASSGGRGAARMACLGTLLTFLGLGAGIGIGLERVNAKGPFWPPLPTATDPRTVAQILGFALALVSFVVSELWLILAIGQMGSALRDRTAAIRAGRFAAFLGLATISSVVGGVAWRFYPEAIQAWWNGNVTPQLARAGEHEPVVWMAIVMVGVFFLAINYLRYLGGLRRAARNYVEPMRV